MYSFMKTKMQSYLMLVIAGTSLLSIGQVDAQPTVDVYRSGWVLADSGDSCFVACQGFVCDNTQPFLITSEAIAMYVAGLPFLAGLVNGEFNNRGGSDAADRPKIDGGGEFDWTPGTYTGTCERAVANQRQVCCCIPVAPFTASDLLFYCPLAGGAPSAAPSDVPTTSPTTAPSISPSTAPTTTPSKSPTTTPSKSPTTAPTGGKKAGSGGGVGGGGGGGKKGGRPTPSGPTGESSGDSGKKSGGKRALFDLN